jgi:D-beta-D-heptose 7-phosphate kinase/D-beta-D-heptose 1-phosphate adenosyltransferase
MNTDLLRVVDAFDGLDVLVVGDAMLDSYLTGRADRLCREAPVPIVQVAERLDVPGGAANTAVNARRLGGRVTFLSAVGGDEDGDLLRRSLEASGVSADDVLTDEGRHTLVKERVVAEGQLLLRVDRGAAQPLDESVEDEIIERLVTLYHRVEAVIVSDYGYGLLGPRVIDALTHLQARMPRVLFVDARDLRAYRQVGVTAVKPNYHEAVSLLGESERDGERVRTQQIAAGADRLLELTGARLCAVTLDGDGALLFERGQPVYRTYARRQQQSRAAGAGDTFAAALALALAAGGTTTAAAEIASAAAGIVVAKDGTADCSIDELRATLSSGEKVVEPESIEAVASSLRTAGRRIVFTNGCFDILHRGHITYLNRAKALGDVLVVGVNTDEGVKRLKGPTRPINRLEDRLQVLAALSSVDHVVPFDEPMPTELIKAVRPAVFVKGGDYTRDTLPEAALAESLGGEVRILPFVEDQSTTGILERLQSAESAEASGSHGDGRDGAADGRPPRRRAGSHDRQPAERTS